MTFPILKNMIKINSGNENQAGLITAKRDTYCAEKNELKRIYFINNAEFFNLLFTIYKKDKFIFPS
jgi:hypothetical protein